MELLLLAGVFIILNFVLLVLVLWNAAAGSDRVTLAEWHYPISEEDEADGYR